MHKSVTENLRKSLHSYVSILLAPSGTSKCFDVKSLHPSDLSKTFWLPARPAQPGIRITSRFAQDLHGQCREEETTAFLKHRRGEHPSLPRQH